MKDKRIKRTRNGELSCKQARKLVVPYIERKLSDEELRRFIRHIRYCAECREELETYYIVYKGLMQLDDKEELPTNILEALKEDLEDSDIHLKNMRFFDVISGIVEVLTAVAVMLLAGIRIIEII